MMKTWFDDNCVDTSIIGRRRLADESKSTLSFSSSLSVTSENKPVL